MNQSVASPVLPENPAPIIPPTITATLGEAESLEIQAAVLLSAKAFHKRSKEAAREVKRFIRENRSMQLVLEGKKYPRAEVWQFGAACLGITAMVTKTEELLNEKQEEIGFLAIAHALNSAGRVISGAEAVCMCSEPEWTNAPSFKLRAMAETRSCSRVLRHAIAYVMVMAGLCPTPAEEMGPGEKREREITTPCYECGNKVTKKRSLETRRKFGKELCLDCEKKLHEVEANKILEPLSDPKQVAEHIAQVKKRKANGGAQPIVGVLDAGKEEIA